MTILHSDYDTVYINTVQTLYKVHCPNAVDTMETEKHLPSHTLARFLNMDQLLLSCCCHSEAWLFFQPGSPNSHCARYNMHHTACFRYWHEENDISNTSAVEKLSWTQTRFLRVTSLQRPECQSSVNINDAHCLCSRFRFGLKIKLIVLP